MTHDSFGHFLRRMEELSSDHQGVYGIYSYDEISEEVERHVNIKGLPGAQEYAREANRREADFLRSTHHPAHRRIFYFEKVGEEEVD